MTELDQSAGQAPLTTTGTAPEPTDEVARRLPPAARRPSAPPLRAWLRRDLSDPFFRNANALIANTGLTAVLGLVYWAIAARVYTDPDVGRGSALISAMTLLSGIIAINLSGTLSRFIPAGGRRTWSMVLSAYAFSTVVVLVLTAAFLLSLGRWGPSFELLRDPTTAAWFFAVVVAAGIFTVQDGVLVGLRSAVWVPVENVLFGVAKAALLVPFAVLFPRDGVYLAWVIPMALLIVPVNALIFGRLVPRHVRASPPDAVLPAPRTIGRFFVADYAGALFMFAAATLPPVLVAPFVEPWTFAYFYIAWITAGALHLVGLNLAASLTVEGVYETQKLGVNCRAALRRGLVLIVSATVFVGLLAPYGFGLLGRGYLDAVPMLQALALAAVPRVLIEVWVGVLRAQSRTREIAHVQIACGGGAIAAVLAWLYLKTTLDIPSVELITGVGLAVLVSQVLVAVAILPPMRRFLRETAPGLAPESDAPLAATTVPVIVTTTVPVIVRPSEQAATRRQRVVLGVLVVAAGAAVAVALSGLLRIQPDTMDGYGLVSVLAVTTYVGLGLLTLVFVGTLALQRPHRAFLCLQIVAMACCLHGASAFYASQPRFPVTWVHLGFVDFISRTGTVAGELDGRFSWPGFFALVAFWLGRGSWSDLLPALNFVPLLSNLLYLLPLALILRNLRMSWRAKWLTAWLFVVVNWIGQDYFSPQGAVYWLYLVFVAALLTWLRPPVWEGLRSPRLRRWLNRVRLPVPSVAGELPPSPVSSALQSAILLLLVGVFLVATFSHQLTPFIMLAACVGLVLARRCTTTWLPVLLATLMVAWISYLAVAYWSGHLGELFAGIGDIGGNLKTSIVARAGFGETHQHDRVVMVRIALALTIGALAAVGFLRRLRRGVDDRIVLVLLLAPLAALGLQSYGGEIALRVYLFALPAAVVLVACAFFPESGPVAPRLGRYLLLGPIALILVGGYLVARYGNEAYEQMDDGAVAAMEYVYQQEGPVRVVSLTDSSAGGYDSPPFLPIGYRDIERTSYRGLAAPVDPVDVGEIVAALRELGPHSYLVRTAETDAFLTIIAGFPSDWGERFDRRVAAGGELQLVATGPNAWVYRLDEPRGPPPRMAPLVTGVDVGHTPSTPLGAIFLGALGAIVVGRELCRLRGRPVPARTLGVLCSVLSVGLLAVIIERLVLLV